MLQYLTLHRKHSTVPSLDQLSQLWKHYVHTYTHISNTVSPAEQQTNRQDSKIILDAIIAGDDLFSGWRYVVSVGRFYNLRVLFIFTKRAHTWRRVFGKLTVFSFGGGLITSFAFFLLGVLFLESPHLYPYASFVLPLLMIGFCRSLLLWIVLFWKCFTGAE